MIATTWGEVCTEWPPHGTLVEIYASNSGYVRGVFDYLDPGASLGGRQRAVVMPDGSFVVVTTPGQLRRAPAVDSFALRMRMKRAIV